MSTFDTLHAAKALTQAGFAPPQAEAITDTIRAAFSDSVATKGDMAELRAEIQAVEMRVAERFEALYKQLWVMAVGIVGLTVTLVKLIP